MRIKLGLLTCLLVILMIVLEHTESIHHFITEVQNRISLTAKGTLPASSTVWSVLRKQDLIDRRKELLEVIQAEAAKRRIPPIDAKMDRVWKAIPGYNGLEVDVEQTLRISEHSQQTSSISYIMKEVPPSIQLEDLGPHPIYKGNPQKPMVSLMINVAWGNEFLPSMLDTMRKENVHATFFFDGSWLNKNMETAKLIQSQGHEISNHAYSHKNMSSLGRSKALEEIIKTQALLVNQLGVTNTLFAPPSGDYDQETVEIAAEQGLKTVLWTLDTVDWTNPGASKIIQKVSSNVEPGTLILMHPTVSSSRALEEMIHTIKRKGLTLGTVSELLSSKRVPEPTV